MTVFERFTTAARETVVAARAEALRRGDGWIGTEHLLVGLLGSGGTADVLAAHGVDLADIRDRIDRHVPAGSDDDLDAEALASLGIDLDAVRAAAESRFGVGALAPLRRGRGRPRMTRRAGKVLQVSLREAQHARSSQITAEHVLLGLLREGRGLGVRVLVEAGVDVDRLRREVDQRGRGGRAA